MLYKSVGVNEGKSPGIDNIPGELLKYGGDAIVNVFTEVCQISWSNKEWPKQWTGSLIVPIPKKAISESVRIIEL